MKEALISPIYKGGDRAIAASYKPVAITPHLSKVLEHVIQIQLVSFLKSKWVLDAKQHSLTPGRSTLSQLLLQYEYVLDLHLQGYNVQILYLDFVKAFYQIYLGILLRRLHHLGVRSCLGRWISDFVLGRRQAVKVCKVASSWSQVISGIPKGSILGPLFFLLYIGDLGTNIPPEDALVLKYIDDTKVTKGVSNEEDVEGFQSTLGKVYEWQTLNNMKFNDSKFQVVRLGHNQILKDSTSLFTSNYSELIRPCDQVRDLDIIIQD